MTSRLFARALALPLLLAIAGTARADGGEPGAHDVVWSAHPGAAVAAIVGVAVLVALGIAGIGCSTAILASLFPRMTAALDRQARSGSAASALVVGSLVLVGVFAAAAGAAHSGSPALGLVVAVVLALPACLLWLAGAMATLPLLGERLLGSRGPTASPLSRAVAGSLALAVALIPGVVFRLVPLGFLMALVVLGWPLGVGLAALLSRARSAPPATS